MSARERPVWLVATREIREATKTKSFRLTLLLSAAALAAIIVIANLSDDGRSSQSVIVAGANASERARGIEQLGAAAGVTLDVTTAADDDAARAAVDASDADVAISADGTTLTTREPVDLGDGSDLAGLVNALRADLALENGLAAAGLTPDQVAELRATSPPGVAALRDADTDELDGGQAAAATVTNILLFLMLQTYGQWVLTSVTREKASRVVEVLLAVITPRQLLIGKLIGIGTVALGHAVTLIATALITTRIMGVDLTSGIEIADLALAGAWFVLGYALYCGAYAAAGSLVARVEDAQSASFPVLLPLLLGYFVSFTAIGGTSTLLWVLAFLPPTAVVVMPTLFATGAAEFWMVIVSMALTAVAVLLVAAMAAKIYERSVLHSGKKLGWKEALRRPTEISATAPRRAVTAD